MIRYDGFNISHFSTAVLFSKKSSEYVYVSMFFYFLNLEKSMVCYFVCFKKEKVIVNKHHDGFSMLCAITSHIENVQNE